MTVQNEFNTLDAGCERVTLVAIKLGRSVDEIMNPMSISFVGTVNKIFLWNLKV